MADDLPYMMSVQHVPDILSRIRSAGTPPRFTHEFLSGSLGFASSSDRGVIKVLKALRFCTSDGTPLPRYNEFRGESGPSPSLAAGLREGWEPIFLADQRAHERSTSQLTEIFKNVTGKGEAVAKKMATTFKAFSDQADWSTPPAEPVVPDAGEPAGAPDGGAALAEAPAIPAPPAAGGRLNLHQDIHVHLPPSTDVATYTAIFRALREELLD